MSTAWMRVHRDEIGTPPDISAAKAQTRHNFGTLGKIDAALLDRAITLAETVAAAPLEQAWRAAYRSAYGVDPPCDVEMAQTLDRESIQAIVAQACKAIGLPPLASREDLDIDRQVKAASGADLATLGHASIATTSRYLHPRPGATCATHSRRAPENHRSFTKGATAGSPLAATLKSLSASSKRISTSFVTATGR